MAKEFHYTWTWDLQSSPEALWPFMSDTNRFNRDTGLPPIILLEIMNGVKRTKFNIPVINIEWEEEPFEWTYPTHFGVLRRYKTGPLQQMRVDCQLQRSENGTRIIYNVWATSRNILGDIAIPLGVGIFSAKKFEAITRRYDRIAESSNSIMLMTKRENLSSARRVNLKSKMEQLKNQNVDESIIDRLFEFLNHADDFSVQRMRPYALADGWNLPRRAMLETFLRATRIGILDMYWDLLCPECRGVTEDISHLSDVHATSHCNTCQIDFSANFDHNIEVIFRPNASVREVDKTIEFCVGNPQRQTHIMFSTIVQPHENLSLSTMIDEGRYLLRASQLSGAQNFLATKNGAKKVDVLASDAGWQTGLFEIGLMPYINLINETDHAQVFELVHSAWSDQSATAADVTTLQVFRDLFSSEVFRPGEEISIGSTTLMFTDLRGSTKLYREIGDAQAFSRVREHFDILERAIAAEGGSVVKTIGDAVMAAFRSPEAAIRAIWDVQKELTSRGQPLLMIKVGIHQGPCIAVNLNDRLDYFGSTVNITSRLPGFSTGGEVIFSQQIHENPEVMAFLEKNALPNSMTKFSGDIRGYDEPMDLWKVKMGEANKDEG